MNYSRLGLAALGGTVAYFAFGFLLVWLARFLSMKPTNARPYSDPRKK